MLEAPFITALRQAAEAEHRDLSLITQFVEAGANIEGVFAFSLDLSSRKFPFKLEVKGTPLQFAMIMGSTELFSYLHEKLKKKYYINDTSFKGSVFKWLTERTSGNTYASNFSHPELSLIEAAALSGNLELVKEALEGEYDKNENNVNARFHQFFASNEIDGTKSHFFITPITLAAIGGHHTVIQYLYDKGAVDHLIFSHELNDNSLPPYYSLSPLNYAAMTDNSELATFLLKECKGKALIDDKQYRFDYTPLMEAAKADSVNVAKLLIQEGADVNALCLGRCATKESKKGIIHQGATALYIAADYKSLKVANLLLNEANINLNVVNNQGGTALGSAIYRESKEITMALLNANPHIGGHFDKEKGVYAGGPVIPPYNRAMQK